MQLILISQSFLDWFYFFAHKLTQNLETELEQTANREKAVATESRDWVVFVPEAGQGSFFS